MPIRILSLTKIEKESIVLKILEKYPKGLTMKEIHINSKISVPTLKKVLLRLEKAKKIICIVNDITYIYIKGGHENV